MAVFVKKALAVLKFETLHCSNKLVYLLSNLVRVTRADDTATESARSFYFVNLVFLASMILLSPDKIPQILGSTQSGFAIFDMFEGIPALLKRILPF